MRLIANCQLSGDYGTVVRDQEFQAIEETGLALIKAGAARRALPPRILYETKPAKFETPTVQAEAPGVSARDMFPIGYLPMSHPQPAPVASEGDSVLPKPNVSEQGTSDTRGRRGRKGPGAER